MIRYLSKRNHTYWFRRRINKGTLMLSLKTSDYTKACLRHSQLNLKIQKMLYEGTIMKLQTNEIQTQLKDYRDSIINGEYTNFLEQRDQELSTYDNGEFYGGHTSKALHLAVKRYEKIYNSNDLDKVKLETAKILKRSDLQKLFSSLQTEEELRSFHWELFKEEWNLLKHAFHEQKKIEDDRSIDDNSSKNGVISINDDTLKSIYPKHVLSLLQELMGQRDESKITISRLIEMYIQENKTAKDWSDKNERDLNYVFEHFSSWFDNKAISELERIDFVIFRDTVIVNLPASSQNKILKGKSTRDILKIVEKENLKTIGKTTVNKHIRRLHQVFEWATMCDYLDKNLTKDLALKDKNKSKKQQTKKLPYSKEELETIFEQSPWFTDKLRLKLKYNPDHIFIPLLALYTGAKPTELATLKVASIKKRDGIFGIDFNEKLKTADSERFTPLAKELLDMGFLKFVNHKKNQKSKLLFPDLKIYKGGGTKFTNDYTKFNRDYITASENKSFYSFRHLAVQKLKDNKVNIYTINAITGHSDRTGNKDLGVYGNYEMQPSDLQEAIDESLVFDLDFSHIKEEINSIYS